MPSKSSVVAVLKELKSKGNAKNVAGMACFGIAADKAYSVPHSALQRATRALV